MAAELCYTSSRKGLFPPAHGFCTVAATAGLPPLDIEQLEGLSGYRPRFALDHPRADHNPVAFGHTLIGGGTRGGRRSVLTRAAHAGADYTGRNNKFVHHLLLENTDRADAGPAWMLGHPGLMRTAWDQAPQTLSPPPAPPAGDTPPAECRAWGLAAGDAGWAGVPAEWHLLNPAAPTWLIYDPDQHDPLALTAEAIALLPVAHRWSVTFNTYFTPTTGGPDCAWRWVITGTAAAQAAHGARVIDLTRPLDPAHDSRYVSAARTGQRIAEPATRSTPATPASAALPAPATTAPTHVPPPPTPPALEAPRPVGPPRARRVAPAALLTATSVLVGYALLPGSGPSETPPPRMPPDPVPRQTATEPSEPPPAAAPTETSVGTPEPPARRTNTTHAPAATAAPPRSASTVSSAAAPATPPELRPAAPTPPRVTRVFTNVPAPQLEASASAGLGHGTRLLPQETLLAAIQNIRSVARVTARSAHDPAAPLRLVAQGRGVAAQLHTAGPLGLPQVRTLGETVLTDRGLAWRWHAEPFIPDGSDPALDDLHDLVRLAVFTATDTAGHAVAEAQTVVPARFDLRPGDPAQPLPPRLDTADPRFVLRDPPPRWTLDPHATDLARATLSGAGGVAIHLHRGSHLTMRWADDAQLPAAVTERVHEHERKHAELTTRLDTYAAHRNSADAALAALPQTADGKPDYARRDQPRWKTPFLQADQAQNKLAVFTAEHAPDGIDALQARAAERVASLAADRARLADHAQLNGLAIDLVVHASGVRLAEITLKGDTP